MSVHEGPKFLCRAKLHYWESRLEARKCCRGWVRVLAPWFYGCPHVDRARWYDPGEPQVFTVALIPTQEAAELARLRRIVPADLQLKFEFEDVYLH